MAPQTGVNIEMAYPQKAELKAASEANDEQIGFEILKLMKMVFGDGRGFAHQLPLQTIDPNHRVQFGWHDPVDGSRQIWHGSSWTDAWESYLKTSVPETGPWVNCDGRPFTDAFHFQATPLPSAMATLGAALQSEPDPDIYEVKNSKNFKSFESKGFDAAVGYNIKFNSSPSPYSNTKIVNGSGMVLPVQSVYVNLPAPLDPPAPKYVEVTDYVEDPSTGAYKYYTYKVPAPQVTQKSYPDPIQPPSWGTNLNLKTAVPMKSPANLKDKPFIFEIVSEGRQQNYIQARIDVLNGLALLAPKDKMQYLSQKQDSMRNDIESRLHTHGVGKVAIMELLNTLDVRAIQQYHKQAGVIPSTDTGGDNMT